MPATFVQPQIKLKVSRPPRTATAWPYDVRSARISCRRRRRPMPAEEAAWPWPSTETVDRLGVVRVGPPSREEGPAVQNSVYGVDVEKTSAVIEKAWWMPSLSSQGCPKRLRRSRVRCSTALPEGAANSSCTNVRKAWREPRCEPPKKGRPRARARSQARQRSSGEGLGGPRGGQLGPRARDGVVVVDDQSFDEAFRPGKGAARGCGIARPTIRRQQARRNEFDSQGIFVQDGPEAEGTTCHHLEAAPSNRRGPSLRKKHGRQQLPSAKKPAKAV